MQYQVSSSSKSNNVFDAIGEGEAICILLHTPPTELISVNILDGENKMSTCLLVDLENICREGRAVKYLTANSQWTSRTDLSATL